MPKFAYQARSAQKNLLSGTIDAESPAAAVRELSDQGIFPIQVRLAEEPARATAAKAQRISIEDLSVGLRQLSDLLEAGLPVAAVLQMAGSQTSHAGWRDLMRALATKVQEGQTLSQAAAGYPDVFPPFYRHLIHAGESGGMLGPVLERLANDSEREHDLRSQLRSAMAYPLFIMVVGSLTILFMLGVIIPKMSALFSDFRATLPLPTRMLLAVSAVVRRWGVVLLILGGGGGFWFWRRRGFARFKPLWDRWSLKLPVVKTWVLQNETSHFARTLGSLLHNGVPVLDALTIAIQTLRNSTLQRGLEPMVASVGAGLTLSQALRDQPLLPAYVGNLVAVGEEGGRLDRALLKVADTFEAQAQRQLKTAMSLVEPVLILVVGLVLGAVVISIMLPIFEMNTLVH